jgi:hypothetical protein
MLWGSASAPLTPASTPAAGVFDAQTSLNSGASKQDASRTVPSGSAGGVQLGEAASMLNLGEVHPLTKTETLLTSAFFGARSVLSSIGVSGIGLS